jgi:hypothetical protein
MFSKKEIVVTYTIEKCNLCSYQRKREFKNGEYLFQELSSCSECDGTILVEEIFGEVTGH